MSIDPDAAGGDVKEARDQVHQGGLARAAGPDQRHYLAPRDHQVDLSQHLPFAFFIAVVEADIFEADLLAEFLDDVGAGLLPHLVLGIHEAKYLRGCAQRLLKVVIEESELAHRLVQLEHRDDKGEEGSGGERVVADAVAAHPAAVRRWPPRQWYP